MSPAGLARDGLAAMAAAGVGAAAQFAVVLVVTRSFSAEVAGALFSAAALCLMVAGVVRLDAGNGLVYFLARPGAPPGYVRAALLPVAALSVAAAVTVAFLAGPVAAATGVPAGWIRLFAAAVPVIACAEVVLAGTRGLGVTGPTLGGLVQPVLQLALVAWVALAGAGGMLLPLAWTLPYLPVLAVAGWWLRRRAPRGPYRPGTARGMWRHTAPRAVAGALQAVFQRLDIVIVAVLAGPVEAACYTAATRFKVIGQLASQAVAGAAQPRLVRALASGDLPAARRLYQVTTVWLVALTWPLWAAYALAAPWLLRLFGDGYARGSQVAVVLAATMMVASACGTADVVLTAAGHTTASMVNTAATIAVTVTAHALLVPALGAYGAALGWSAGMLVKNLLPLLRLHREHGLRPFGRYTALALRPHAWTAA